MSPENLKNYGSIEVTPMDMISRSETECTMKRDGSSMCCNICLSESAMMEYDMHVYIASLAKFENVSNLEIVKSDDQTRIFVYQEKYDSCKINSAVLKNVDYIYVELSYDIESRVIIIRVK